MPYSALIGCKKWSRPLAADGRGEGDMKVASGEKEGVSSVRRVDLLDRWSRRHGGQSCRKAEPP